MLATACSYIQAPPTSQQNTRPFACSLTLPYACGVLSCSWITDTYELSKLAPYATDKSFQAKWREVKQANKAKLAAYVKETFGDDVPLNAMFDIQVGTLGMLCL